MFGRIASTEPRQLWLRGDDARVFACAGAVLGTSSLGKGLLGTKVNGLGSGRRGT